MPSRQLQAKVSASRSRGEEQGKGTKETTISSSEQSHISCNLPVTSVFAEGIRNHFRAANTMAQQYLALFYALFFSLLLSFRLQLEEDSNNSDRIDADETKKENIERSLTGQISKEKQQFIVSIYYNKDKITSQTFPTKEEAEAIYNEHTLSSRVIMTHYFDGKEIQHKLVKCCSASWDLQGLGVATVLYCDENDKILDGSNQEVDMIRKKIDQGILPFVPPQRDQKVQKRLKTTMRLVFKRKTVAYFGSAPLHYKSLNYFPPSSQSQASALIRQKIRENATSVPASEQQKYVALTLDDAPCRFSDTDSSEIPKVLALLRKYNVKATFMVVGSWCRNHEDDLIRLIQDGHELANHCMMDRSYEFDDPKDFGNAVDECSAIIQDLYLRAGVTDKSRCPYWAFRAPHGRYTQEMARQLASRGLVNVMCDTYASCPVVEDGDFVGKHLTNTCKDGSIILLHMPEVHVRQWCLTALEKLLKGLKHRNMQAIPLGEMARIHSFRPEAGPASLFRSNAHGCLP